MINSYNDDRSEDSFSASNSFYNKNSNNLESVNTNTNTNSNAYASNVINKASKFNQSNANPNANIINHNKLNDYLGCGYKSLYKKLQEWFPEVFLF